MAKAHYILLGLGFWIPATGCVDGPLYAIKRINPYYTRQWKADEAHGPTYEQRFAELAYVENRLPAMDASEQAEWSARLADLVATDPSPEMRARAVRAVAQLPTPAATKALNQASADDSEKVRMVACEAWAIHGGTSARDMLLSIAQRDDETTSVRRAAVASLSEFPEAEVQNALAKLIDDTSPAIQFAVAQSLKTQTGQDFGGDIEGWKQYIASNNAPAAAAPGSANPPGSTPGGIQTASGQMPTDPPSLARPTPPGLPQLR